MSYPVRLTITVTETQQARIDQARGIIPLTAWARRAFEQALTREGFPPTTKQDR